MNSIRETVKSYFSYGEQIVVAVSGGADSMVLLDALLHADRPIYLTVAHLNHQLRGAESDRDEAFVRAYCEKNHLPFVCERKEIGVLAKKRGISVELCGRQERYAFFDTLTGRIATAHTLSDRVETMLFHLARGTGPAGLFPIPQQRGRIVRPLLSFTRADIEAYCAAYQIAFCEDATNREDAYTRNRIRHQIVPVLREINPQAERHMLHTMQLLSEDEAFLQECAKRAYRSVYQPKQEDAVFGQEQESCLLVQEAAFLPPSVRRRVLCRFLNEFGITPTGEMLERMLQLLARGEGRQSLPNGFTAAIRRRRLYLDRPARKEKISAFLPDLPRFCAHGFAFVRCGGAECDQIINNAGDRFILAVDYDKISGDVFLRSKEPQDALCLFKRPRKTLKSLMQEAGLSPAQRSRCLVLADEEGSFWADGFGADRRVLPGQDTKRYLLIFRANAREDNAPGVSEREDGFLPTGSPTAR